MDSSPACVLSEDTYLTPDMRLQVQDGCPVILCIIYRQHLNSYLRVLWHKVKVKWSDVFLELLQWKVIRTKHKKIFFMQISHTFILSRCPSEAQSLMWRKQAAREKMEDLHDRTTEPQKCATLENTCCWHGSLTGKTKYEGLGLKVGVSFMLIYSHSCITVVLDQHQVTWLILKC